MKFLLLSFLAGLVGACGFEPLGLWPLTLAAFALLLWLIQQAPSLRGALARGYWFGVGNFTLGLNWIATAFTYQAAMPAWLGWLAVVLLSLYLAVYPAMATGLAWRWGRTLSPSGEREEPRSGGGRGEVISETGDSPSPQPSPLKGRGSLALILIFAAAWIVTEWLRGTMFTGFPWNPVGVALLPTPVSYVAKWIGTYGLSGVAMLLAGALLLFVQRAWRSGAAVAASVAAVTAAAALASAPPEGMTRTQLRIVQPNIDQREKWREDFVELNYARLIAASGRPGREPRLLLWPEVAIPDFIESGYPPLIYDRPPELVRARLASLLGPRDILFTGAPALVLDAGGKLVGVANSVYPIDAAGRLLGRYDKAHLTPYGEYLPMRPLLSAIGLSRLAPGDYDTTPGPGPRSLPIPGVGLVGFQTCYEIIFSGEVVDEENRPGFLFNPSNDAWFGRWGPPQHLAQARLRALEEGLPVLRSTPTGISAVIDAEGRLLRSLPWRTAGVIDTLLPAPKAPTLFARLGNVLPFLFALLLVGIAIAVRRKAR
jgi:apolipoprotein N-acyltransferase